MQQIKKVLKWANCWKFFAGFLIAAILISSCYTYYLVQENNKWVEGSVKAWARVKEAEKALAHAEFQFSLALGDVTEEFILGCLSGTDWNGNEATYASKAGGCINKHNELRVTISEYSGRRYYDVFVWPDEGDTEISFYAVSARELRLLDNGYDLFVSHYPDSPKGNLFYLRWYPDREWNGRK